MGVSVLLLTAHLLGVGLVVGTVFATLIFVQKNLSDPASLKIHHVVRRLGTVGAGLAILTGILMAYRYQIPLRGNWSLDIKLGLIALDGLIAHLVIGKQIESAVNNTQSDSLRSKLLGWAWLSVVIVIAIITVSVYRDKIHS